MHNSLKERLYRWTASLFIGGVLFAQAATVPFTAARSDFIGSRLYPIVAYDMYRETHNDAERVDASWLLEGMDAEGRVVDISADMLKMSIWDWKRILRLASEGNEKEGITPLKELVLTKAPGANSLQSLRIKTLPIRVTRNGPEKIPSETLITIPLQTAK